MNTKFEKILELIKQNQFENAKKECLKLVNLKLNDPEIFNLLAIICFQLEEYEDAIKNWKKSTEINSKYFFAYNNIGKAFLSLKKYENALENFNRTIDIKSDFFEAYNNKGNVLVRLGRLDEALKSYNKAIEINPNNLLSYIFKGHALLEIRNLDEALKSYQNAYSINPNHPLLLGYILNTKAQICDWENFNENIEKLKVDLSNKKKATFPFTTLTLLDDPDLQLQSSEIWVKEYQRTDRVSNKIFTKKDNSKIKLGYFTADFRDHATSHLTAEMFENHDKSKFEIIGFYLGGKIEVEDLWHDRLKKSFDKFYYLKEKSDQEILNLVRDLNIDIAVDLMAHCNNGMENRFGIFARGCAPIQINFLGYPGTSGSKSIDYIIADKTTIPIENQKFFTEKIIYLPDTYQPNNENVKKNR